MISFTNHDFQWGRSEVVIIYPDYMPIKVQLNPVKSSIFGICRRSTDVITIKNPTKSPQIYTNSIYIYIYIACLIPSTSHINPNPI